MWDKNRTRGRELNIYICKEVIKSKLCLFLHWNCDTNLCPEGHWPNIDHVSHHTSRGVNTGVGHYRWTGEASMRHWSQDYWKTWSSSQCCFSSLTFIYVMHSSLKSHQHISFNVRVSALDYRSTSISKMDKWTKAFCSQTFRLSLNILSKKNYK